MPAAFSGDNLPFPGSLPEFQRLFPNDAACATYLGLVRKLPNRLLIERIGGLQPFW